MGIQGEMGITRGFSGVFYGNFKGKRAKKYRMTEIGVSCGIFYTEGNEKGSSPV